MKIKAIITGSTGMVGKGVLYECLESNHVESVLIINRRPSGIQHEKLTEIILKDFYNLTTLENQLKGYSACYFCLGVSAFRMSEVDYSKITHDLTMGFAKLLLKLNPGITFCYVSGLGTDSTEKGRSMWARVKGKTENDLLAMPFKASYMFRPGFIQPMKGIRSSTRMYNTMYAIFKPLLPIFKKLTPKSITSTTQVGQAMIRVVLDGYDKQVLNNNDMNILARGS